MLHSISIYRSFDTPPRAARLTLNGITIGKWFKNDTAKSLRNTSRTPLIVSNVATEIVTAPSWKGFNVSY